MLCCVMLAQGKLSCVRLVWASLGNISCCRRYPEGYWEGVAAEGGPW
jgi:hypothetical protein